MGRIQAIGIILWFAFYGSYFLKAYGEKRRGISVNRMGRGTKPPGTRIIEIFLTIITYAMAGVQLLSVIFYGKWALVLVKAGETETGIFPAVIGTSAAAAGIIFFIIAMWIMRDNWRAGIDESQDTSFVTEGIYKLSRNPAFVGFDLFYIGYAILFSNGLQLLFALLGIMTLHMQIKEEEKHLEKRYGSFYSEYKKKVRRYL